METPLSNSRVISIATFLMFMHTEFWYLSEVLTLVLCAMMCVFYLYRYKGWGWRCAFSDNNLSLVCICSQFNGTWLESIFIVGYLVWFGECCLNCYTFISKCGW